MLVVTGITKKAGGRRERVQSPKTLQGRLSAAAAAAAAEPAAAAPRPELEQLAWLSRKEAISAARDSGGGDEDAGSSSSLISC